MGAVSFIDFNNLKKVMNACNIEEKIEIIRILEKETFPARFKQLLQKIKTDEFNFDEITAEVEAVRQKRYDAKKYQSCN